MIPTAKDLFLDKVCMEPMSGCWLWTAYCDSKGYGRVWDGTSVVLAHRRSMSLFRGDPGIMCVLHRCDNPTCVNPDHLFLGTQRDNIEDMHKKGRRKYQSKLECPQGHPYIRGNIAMEEGYKRCLTCRRAKDRRIYWKSRAT